MAVCPKCHDRNPKVGVQCPKDGYYFVSEEALKDAANDPRIGSKIIGKYVVTAKISEGGMGAVYRALQMPIEREVAVKVLRTELQSSEQIQERFFREARAIAMLDHPNIVTMFDYGVEEGGQKYPYMVMEYAPGQSLAQWLLQDGLTIERILTVTEQILSALVQAHSTGVVHRDLKPDNMIVTKSGANRDFIKLLDFGIARMVNQSATKHLTKEGEVFGTPHYMAPEQARGKKDIGPPVDLYAVGIMIWEMICGDCPFDAATPLSVLFMHINEELPALRPRDGIQVTPAVEELIRKATEKEVANRFQTAEEMLEALYGILGQPTRTGSFHAAPKQDLAAAVLEYDIPDPHVATLAPDGDLGNQAKVYDPEPSLLLGQPEVDSKKTTPEDRKTYMILGVLLVLIALTAVGIYLLWPDADSEALASLKPEEAAQIDKAGIATKDSEKAVAEEPPTTPEEPPETHFDEPIEEERKGAESETEATEDDPTEVADTTETKQEPEPEVATKTTTQARTDTRPRTNTRTQPAREKTKEKEEPKSEPKFQPKIFERPAIQPEKEKKEDTRTPGGWMQP